MPTYNVSAVNTPMTNQVLVSDYNGAGQWNSDLIVNSVSSGTLTAGVIQATALNAPLVGTSIINGTNGSISINSGTYNSNYYGHPYGCSCTYCSPQMSGGAGSLGQTYTSGGLSGNITVEVAPQDQMKSKPKNDEGVHDHIIECRLRVETTKVISEYFCQHCNEVLYSKVISRLPKSIMNKKCLPRLVKGV